MGWTGCCICFLHCIALLHSSAALVQVSRRLLFDLARRLSGIHMDIWGLLGRGQQARAEEGSIDEIPVAPFRLKLRMISLHEDRGCDFALSAHV